MDDLSWTATSPLARALVAGRHGVNFGAAGVILTEIRGFDLIQVMARRGVGDALMKAAKQHFGVASPVRPLAVQAKDAVLVWSGPDQFLALSERRDGGNAFDAARKALTGKASLSEQSDGRVLLSLSGPKVRNALAKLCSLDLHPAAFPPGTAAATSIDHTGVNLWRAGDAADGVPVLLLLVFSTFAESLFETILDAAAEYGVDVGSAEAGALPRV